MVTSSWPTILVSPPPSAPWPTPTPRSARWPGSSPPPTLHTEIGSGRFCGGLLVERSAGLHPAKLAAGLARAAVDAGAGLHGATTVLAMERRGPGFELETSRGALRSVEVVVATNGTTDGRLVRWLGRRILPVGSYMIATEPLDPEVAASVNPHGRMFFDTRNFLHYWRLSPDRTRVLFGGRTSLAPTTVERSRDLLYAAMVAIHPQLAGVRVDRAWGGQVALTADRLPACRPSPRLRRGVRHGVLRQRRGALDPLRPGRGPVAVRLRAACPRSQAGPGRPCRGPPTSRRCWRWRASASGLRDALGR